MSMAQTKSATEMKKATESKLLEKAQKEFYSVVNTFILPLCDPRGTLKPVSYTHLTLPTT